MVNEDLVTILRNAVNKGEPLQSAMQVLTNSGYDPQQIQEASKYVQGGAMQGLSPKPDEHLIMAQNRGMFQNNQINQPPVNPQMKPQMNNMQQNQMQNPQMNAQMKPQMNNMQQNQPFQKPTNQKDPFASKPLAINELQQLTKPTQTPAHPIQNQQPMNQQMQQQAQTMDQQNASNNPNQKSEIKLKKKSHKKEIILLIILLFLIGVLVSTIIFRDTLLNFLSG